MEDEDKNGFILTWIRHLSEKKTTSQFAAKNQNLNNHISSYSEFFVQNVLSNIELNINILIYCQSY